MTSQYTFNYPFSGCTPSSTNSYIIYDKWASVFIRHERHVKIILAANT